MHDYYLTANDEAAMLDALTLVECDFAIDVIGEWFDYDPETETSTARQGWHFNVRSATPIEWPDTITQNQPVSPWRVWG